MQRLVVLTHHLVVRSSRLWAQRRRSLLVRGDLQIAGPYLTADPTAPV